MVQTAIALEQDRIEKHSRFVSGPAIVLYLALGKLVFHLLTASRYGVFRDEMYYVACSEHLAWGCVDHPPMNVLIAWVAHHLFETSLLGLRVFPALARAGVESMQEQRLSTFIEER
jgi:hypothetical protein